MAEGDVPAGADRRRGRGRSLGIFAALVLAVVAGAVYVTLRGGGNSTADAACRPAAAQAAKLDAAIGGEVAAFQLASASQDLSALAFLDAGEKPATLAAFKGKVALVNLWATWCGPCRKEMPALDRLQGALGGPDFAVAPISIDIGGRDKPAAFLASVGAAQLPLYTDPSTDIFEALKRRGLAIGLPVTLLLDRKGCTLGHMNGPAEWDGPDGRRLIEAAISASS